MAKGGKGRKGGGGGGGKTRKYSRDNKGRFASTGSGGATARGGRLKTASGNKRKTQTITATGQKGVLAKPKGLKPESTNRLKTGIFISKRRAVNAQLANKPDQAVVNIPGRFTGRAGKSFDASITRAVATVKASKDAKFKTKAEVKADQAKTKAAKEAKPKRVRSAESLRVSRAKQVEKRRSITTNPAGVRASAAAKMAANATRTQQRAAAFYKAGGKPAAKPATATPKAKSPKFTTEQSGRVRRAALGGGRTAIVRKNSAVIINAKGEPIMTRKGLPNITAGKKYAANPNARGPRLMGRDRSEASPSRGYIRTSKPTGTIGKPKGLKPGSIELKPATAKPARFSASELAERKGYAKQLMAQPKGVRKANYLQRKAQKNPDQLDRFKGRMKFGTQNTINNITEGRSYLTAKKSQFANTPEKRASIERSVTNSGRSLQARMKTTNLGTRLRRLNKPVTTKAAKTKGTIGKPKGLKPGSIKPKAAAAKPARATAKPAVRRKSVGSISEAKAGRIISRIDANRPGLRRASGSARKTANAIRTQQRATDFALAASARGRKQGKNLSVNQSLQRAIKNASAKAKPAAKPAAATKPAALKTKKARTDEGAFGDRYKRAGKVGLKRSIKESDNLNNPTGKATFEKRFAATQQRQSQADRTAAAAKDFYSRFGSPMSFAQRPKLSTAGGARFGVKKKPARKPRGMR